MHGNGLHSPGPPRGVRRRHVWEPNPSGPVYPDWPRGARPPFPPEGVRRRHVPPQAAREAAAGPTLPRARGRRPSAGRRPNYCIYCG
jgi:hypothetical protein